MKKENSSHALHCPAVLFLIFNRPDLTRQSFVAIRAARPERLFIAADGPRADRPDDAAKCRETREIATAVDWPCEVKTLFRENNYGCRIAVSSAITWFFEHVEEGIILEDDCIPGRAFFTFCREMLKRYRNEPRVAHIAGYNHFPCDKTAFSYYFSHYPGVWGWATWRRAWVDYEVDMHEFETVINSHQFANRFYSDSHYNYWVRRFESVFKNEIDSWGYQWTYTIRKNGKLCIRPAKNLVQNIGFSEQATHTKVSNARISNNVYQDMEPPFQGPEIAPDRVEDDKFLNEHLLGTSGKQRTIMRLSRFRRREACLNLAKKNMQRFLNFMRDEYWFRKRIRAMTFVEHDADQEFKKTNSNTIGTDACFAITGMHRSGTSLLASLLQDAGMPIGTQMLPAAFDNPRGYFEDVDFVNYHNHVMRKNGADLILPKRLKYDVGDIINAKRLLGTKSKNRTWGWKDPRTIWFLGFWKELIPNFCVIAVYRDPYEVIDSLTRRMSDTSVRKSPFNAARSWLYYNNMLLNYGCVNIDKFILFPLSEIVDNWEKCCDTINTKFGIDLHPQDIRRVYDSTALRRHPKTTELLFHTRLLYGKKLSLVYKALSDLSLRSMAYL